MIVIMNRFSTGSKVSNYFTSQHVVFNSPKSSLWPHYLNNFLLSTYFVEYNFQQDFLITSHLILPHLSKM